MQTLKNRCLIWIVAIASVTRLSAAAAEPQMLEEWANSRIDAILADYHESGDLGNVAGQCGLVMDMLIAWSPEPRESEALGRAYALRHNATDLAGLASGGANNRYRELASWMFADAGEGLSAGRRGIEGGWGLAQAIAALRWSEIDNANAVYRIVADLYAEHGGEIGEYPELVAAIAVVFDTGLASPLLDPEIPDRADAADVFGHYIENNRALQMNPRTVPGELLIHAVDAPVHEGDLAWGLKRCGRTSRVGMQFHQINYDQQALAMGDEFLRLKNAGEDGFGLPAILRYGGVCRHQAFFAVSLGKAIGVPTVYVTAAGPDMGHAWVGYLRPGAGGVVWDMTEGRFGDYEEIRGTIFCPQSHRTLSDQQVAMTAELWKVPLADRVIAAACAASAIRVTGHEERPMDFPPELPDGVGGDGGTDARSRMASRSVLETPRGPTVAARIAMLRESVEASPYSRRGWELFKKWAHELDDAQRFEWFETLHKLVGREYPDVLVTTASPMIETMTDRKARDDAWDWLARRVNDSEQLSLEIAVRRGKGYEADDDPAPRPAWASRRCWRPSSPACPPPRRGTRTPR